MLFTPFRVDLHLFHFPRVTPVVIQIKPFSGFLRVKKPKVIVSFISRAELFFNVIKPEMSEGWSLGYCEDLAFQALS